MYQIYVTIDTLRTLGMSRKRDEINSRSLKLRARINREPKAAIALLPDYVIVYRSWLLTQIHGCFSASLAVILFPGFTVSIWFIRFLASGVTVSHSGLGYCAKGAKGTFNCVGDRERDALRSIDESDQHRVYRSTFAARGSSGTSVPEGTEQSPTRAATASGYRILPYLCFRILKEESKY